MLLDPPGEYIKKAIGISASIGTVLHADWAYENLQRIIERMESAGMELSEEDRKEIAELTEAYEKLKGEAVGTAAS